MNMKYTIINFLNILFPKSKELLKHSYIRNIILLLKYINVVKLESEQERY